MLVPILALLGVVLAFVVFIMVLPVITKAYREVKGYEDGRAD